MKYLAWILPFLFIACGGNNSIKKTQNFVEKALEKDAVVINLPEFEYGIPFVGNDSTQYINIYLLNDSLIQVNNHKISLKKEKSENSFLVSFPVDSARILYNNCFPLAT